MKRTVLMLIITGLTVVSSNGQYSSVPATSSFKYVSSPGFVNITEFNGAVGLEDTIATNSAYYLGLTNVFGYQIDRNFFGGIGIGYYHYDTGYLLPVFLEYRYSYYFRSFTPFLYGDGGLLINPGEFSDESKIFINPGIGVSRVISRKMEINFSAGYMIQARSTLTRVTFINFKIGVIFRKISFRMFRKS